MLLLIERLAPLLLPLDSFYFRPWEYMATGRKVSVTMKLTNGYGDLANMIGLARYRVPRRFVWTNDAYGFRNPAATQHDAPDIIAGGDSFMAGAADSDEALFAVQLQQLTGRSVTNYARADLCTFLTDERFRKAPPPTSSYGEWWRGISRKGTSPRS